MIEQIGFKNFRRFEDFPFLKFGKINIFVGRNNAGKSTVLKALQLFKGNLKTLSNFSSKESNGDNIFSAQQPMFLFDVDELAELHIDNFERALYNKAKRKEITLSATIDGCSITIVLDGQNAEQNNNFVAVPYNRIELKDNNFLLNFNVQTRELHLEIEDAGSTNYDDKLNLLQTERKEIMERIRLIDKQLAEIAYILNDVEGLSISNEEMIQQISKRSSLQKTLAVCQKQEAQLIDEINMIMSKQNGHVTFTIKQLPVFIDSVRSDVIRMLFEDLLKYSQTRLGDRRKAEVRDAEQIQNSIISIRHLLVEKETRFVAALESFQLQYIHAHSASQKVIYLKEDKSDTLSRALYEFCKARIFPGSSEWQFIKKWMGSNYFSIGEDFRIDDIQSAGYTLRILEDGNYLNLADKGTGSIQIMTLLLSLAVIMHKSRSGNVSPVILIEEPEQNIHPMLQSILADMFFEFWTAINDNIECQLIIETHSECFVRRTQLFVAEKKYKTEDEMLADNPFKVFYFDKGNIQRPFYSMEYNVNGRFKESFGAGFYDAAGSLALELSQNEPKSDSFSFDWNNL